MTIYWVERDKSRGRWKREEAWTTWEEAERGAKFYRAYFHRRARIVVVERY